MLARLSSIFEFAQPSVIEATSTKLGFETPVKGFVKLQESQPELKKTFSARLIEHQEDIENQDSSYALKQQQLLQEEEKLRQLQKQQVIDIIVVQPVPQVEQVVVIPQEQPRKRRSPWALYNQYLVSHPISVKSGTSLVIGGLGDVMSQLFVSTEAFDYVRLVRMLILGGFFVGPTLHYWFLALSRMFPGQGVKAALCRVAVDQLLFSAFFLVTFFGLLLLLEGHPEQLPGKIRNDLWDVCKSNWKVWIPVQAINFGLVPPHFQVLFANLVGLAWNCYLSYVANRPGGN